VIIHAVLVLIVLSVWLGCVGYARLRTAYDRLHCVTFVAASAGPLVVLMAFLADGPSDRAWKILLTVLLVVVNGTALTHATGRALGWRDMSGEDS
jgi:multisubunit Na+/H+ antiporter MnhG subunit